MKAKHIKSVLRRKFDIWVESIEDGSLRALVKRDSIISGGAITSMLLNEKIHDYDVYFKTHDTALNVAKYYVEQFKQNPPARFKGSEQTVEISVQDSDDRIKIVVKSAGIAGEDSQDTYAYFEQVSDPTAAEEYVADALEATEPGNEDTGKKKYRPVFLSSNAITLSDNIQLVIRFFGSVECIHENFDFMHCTCSWDAYTNELSLPKAALEAILARDLQYLGGSKYPLCSIIRTRKFIKRGWNINAGQYVKMCWDVSQLDLSDMAVLEDQMVGVDAAYFMEVLTLLREHDAEHVDGTYLMQIIDKVF